MSARLSAAPSRFLRMISCGSSVSVRSDAIWNPHVLDLAGVGEEGAPRGLRIIEPVAALAAAHPGALDVIRRQPLYFGAARGVAVVAPDRIDIGMAGQHLRELCGIGVDDEIGRAHL